MSNLQYSLLSADGQPYLTVVAPGHEPQHARPDHPNWDKILQGALADDLGILPLFDPTPVISSKFERLSERVSVKNGRLYFDGDQIDNALTKQVLRFLEEDVEDWQPLVNFFEKVQANPNLHSREQLYRFLDANGMVISLAPDGDIIAYKGMIRNEDENGPYYRPTTHGGIIVDGEEGGSRDLKQRIGSVVEMPRNAVHHNPSNPCSAGLHIATFNFAKGYGTVLEVRVNPRDVVSVPNDSNAQKVRACRYVIVQEVTERYTQALVQNPADVTIEVTYDPDTVSEEGQSEEEQAPVETPHTDTVQEQVADSAAYLNDDPIDYPPHIGEKTVAEAVPDLDTAPHEIEGTYLGYDNPPGEQEFQEMRGRAKRRRRNFEKYATKHGEGWQFVGSDPNNRLHWIKG